MRLIIEYKTLVLNIMRSQHLQSPQLLALWALKNFTARCVAANSVADNSLAGVDIRLTLESELLAEVLGVPCACAEACSASAVVFTVASRCAARGDVTLVERRIERIALLGAH